jgi:hypothetical protein
LLRTFRLCNSSRGFILPSIPFLDPVIASPIIPPFPTLSDTPVFLPCADLALYLTFPARFTHLCGTSTLTYCTISRFLSCRTLPWRAVLLCAATGRFSLGRSTHSHLLAGPGEGFWGDCLHADLPLVCGWQLTFLLRVCRLARFSPFSGSLLCVSLSRVGC